jgi:hypothetical protein
MPGRDAVESDWAREPFVAVGALLGTRAAAARSARSARSAVLRELEERWTSRGCIPSQYEWSERYMTLATKKTA